MTPEEAIEVIKAYRDKLTNSASNQLDGDIEALDMAIKALSQEPCDDAISREWLMRKATERFYTTNYFNHISAMIEEAPSVTQKSGKWIDDGFYAEGHSHKAFHCSKCGHNILGFKEDLSNYCPNCGACMKDGRTLDEFIADSKAESEDKE